MVKIMRRSESCWFLKKAILDFYLNVYCDNNIGSKFNRSKNIRNEINRFTAICVKEFTEISSEQFRSDVKLVR